MQMEARYLARLSKYCTILFQQKTTLRVTHRVLQSHRHTCTLVFRTCGLLDPCLVLELPRSLDFRGPAILWPLLPSP